VSAVVASTRRPRPRTFDLSAEAPRRLAQLAERAKLSSSLTLECLVTMAYDVLVLGRPIRNEQLGPRMRELAAQREHAPKEVQTSFALDERHVDAIRELREALRLPRKDLVVEYVVRAAWEAPPDGDGGNGDPEDPLDRSRRLARFHNVESSRPRQRSLPLPDQRSLFDEEGSSTN
jgi:hypothetical protein